MKSRSTSVTRLALGVLLVLAGLLSAVVTVLARRENENTLAGAAAALSLVIAALLTIFIVPPLARSARLEVANWDIPFEPTSGGGIFFIIIIVVGFAAWNTGNNLLFMVFSLLCSTLFVGWMTARASLTSGGGIFFIIIIVVGFAAWNTGNNLLFMVFSLLCSTLFVGWMTARASLRDLTVSARFPDHIFAGEAAPVIVTLRNTKRVLPSFSILVEARGPNSERSGRSKRYLKRLLAYFSYVP